jgi:hypothetical protein
MVDQPITRPLPTQYNTNAGKTQIYIHALGETWIQYSIVQAVKDIPRIKPMQPVYHDI